LVALYPLTEGMLCKEINPDVEVEVHAVNINTLKHFDAFLGVLKAGGMSGKRVDLVLGCVDNFEVL